MTAWIFDLDGVVTGITEKKITNPKLLAYFVAFLQKGESVTINTGRSLDFIRREVLTPLLAYMQKNNLPESLLHNFFAVGEKGNAWIQDEKDAFDRATAVPQEFAKKVQFLVEKDFSDTMFFDTTKRTMVSTEIHTGLDLTTYAASQHKLIPLLQNMLKEAHLDSEFHLDPNISATDIEHKTAGKAKGTKRILDWLSQRNLIPNKFICFGDSNADIGMGEALQSANKNFTFVFVGEPKILNSQPNFPITFTKELYSEGVVEYLETFE